MRIGVLYPDGSINIMPDKEGSRRAEKEARAECKFANEGETRRKHKAKVVSIDLNDRDIVIL